MMLAPVLLMQQHSVALRSVVRPMTPQPLPPRLLHSATAATVTVTGGRSRFASFLFGVRVFFRGAALLLLWSPAMLLAPVAYLIPGLRGFHAWLVKQCFAWSGPVAIKLAQWVSSRPDLAPLAIAQQLTELQHNAPRHWPQRHQRIDMDGLLVDYSKCIGSGSVAQVYRGSVRDRAVAIKVLHPGVRSAVDVDLALLRVGVWIVDTLFPSYRYLDFPAGLAQFSKEVRSQLDLSLEAANLVRFRALFQDDPEVTFPEPLFVTKDVLVMEYVQGQLLTKLLEEEAKTPEEEAFRKSIASAGMTAFFRMHKNNLVHGDLHAGNIIVSREPGRPHVHLIDVGIVVQLQPSQRDNFWALFSALVMRDGERAAQEMMARGGLIPGVTNEAGFKREMAQIFHDLPLSFRSAPLAKALVGVLDTAARNRVMLDSTFVTLISSCIVLEGTGRKLNPDLSLFQLAKNMLKESRHHV